MTMASPGTKCSEWLEAAPLVSLPQGPVGVVVVPGHFPPAAPVPLLAGALMDSHAFL